MKHKRKTVQRVFARVAGGYDSANLRISLGRQTAWKQALVRELIPEGAVASGLKIADICCGTGSVAAMIKKEYPDAVVTGIDFSEAMLRIAKRKYAKAEGLCFIKADSESLPFAENSFDAAAISFGLRNTTDYRKVLTGMCRVVKDGGRICILDSFLPENRLILPVYRLYFHLIMPFIGGGISRWKEYRLLTETTEAFLTPSELKKLMRETGIGKISIKRSMFGACVLLTGTLRKRMHNRRNLCNTGTKS